MDHEVRRQISVLMTRTRLQRGRCCALALAVLMAACAPRQQDESLLFTIEQALATSPDGADLGQLVGGEWDRVCVFRPRTPSERVDSVLGGSWLAARQSGLEDSDDAALLAFVRGTRVVAHVMYPVVRGDFGTRGPEQWYCLPRSRATFQLRHPIDGSIPWVGPVDSR